MRPTWLESAAAVVSPKLAQRLMAFRVSRKPSMYYEGASKKRRGSHLRRKATDAPGAVRGQLADLQFGCRDLVRNNPYAARGVDAVVNNTIGTGITPQSANGRIEDLLIRHADTTECDADGLHDLYGLQRLAMRTTVEAGECLIRKRPRRPSDGLSVSFQMEVLEPDMIDTAKDGALKNGGAIIQGVEFDAIGRRVAYWLYSNHPGGTVAGRYRLSSTRVDADSIIHLFRVDRPGQVRGVPWLAPAMIKLSDFDDYDQAQLVRQKIAACFAAFVHDNDALEDVAADPDNPGGENENLVEEFEPGMIEYLSGNKSVEFGSPPQVNDYEVVQRVALRAVAGVLGVTYEAISGDLRQVNFSSGRMGHLEMQRSIASNQDMMFIPRFCRGYERWFKDTLSISGNGTAAKPWTWTSPRREMIDPTREVPAVIKAIRGGLTTLSEEIRKTGRDPADLMDEARKDLALLDERGLIFDSDPRRVAAGGTLQSEQPDDEEGNETETDDGTE